MKHSVMLTIASLILILLMTFHLTDDIRHQGGMTQVAFLSCAFVLSVRGLLGMPWGKPR